MSSADPAEWKGPPKTTTLLGHPAGLFVLCFTEFWERFSYYGVRGLLKLYMMNYLFISVRQTLQGDEYDATGSPEDVIGWGFVKSLLPEIRPEALQKCVGERVTNLLANDAYIVAGVARDVATQQCRVDFASELYGVYTALVYLTPVLGGWIADRYLGQKKSVYLGGIAMVLGQFVLFGADNLFFIGLLLLIIGTGFFRPNICAQVGSLYPPLDSRRDGAFVFFYMGIHLGAFICNFICGALAAVYGWRYGFLAAGIGLSIGLLVQFFGRNYLAPDALQERKASGAQGAEQQSLTSIEWKRLWGLMALCLLYVVFWAVYEQRNLAAQMWAEQQPVQPWWASWGGLGTDPVLIVVFGLLLARFWAWQNKRGTEPFSVAKMALGCFILGLPLVVLILGTRLVGDGNDSLLWPLFFTMVLTIGELYLAPVGLSLVTRAAPVRVVSRMVAMWSLAHFASNLLAGYLGQFYKMMSPESFFPILLVLGIAAGVGIWLFNKPMRKLMKPSGRPMNGAHEEAQRPQAQPEAVESTATFEGKPHEDNAAAAAPGAQLSVSEWDRYESLELLGRGGMGVVYKARDRRLGRNVALKFIRDADPGHVMRLLQEARTQARIDHPNVCRVYEVGEVEGQAYIAMQLIEGQQLGRAAPHLPLADKVWVMKEVAAAVHEAHRLGVIHRDLKPSNILVERAESGRWVPVVMDFGLAYEVNQGHGLTQTGAVMGTPAYMAPEQARGELESIDRRTDVYGLGATFYELLTGVPPFTDATLVGTLAKVLNEEPPPLRAHVNHLPVELETIILKCLSKEPHLRYASARALAEDLGRYIDGEPILGQRLSLVQRWKQRARKHRTLVAVGGLSLLSVLMFAVVGARSWLQARHEREQSQARARLAEQLGQQANGMEWLMRTAYMLPLHDVSREEQRVREQMKQIASSKHELGDYGDGLVHYALGRGHLAMHEYEEANEELTRARKKGIDSPGLHYARILVHGELRHRLEQAPYPDSEAGKIEREHELERLSLLLRDAMQALDRGQGETLESAQYVKGLLAFYEREYEAAAQIATQALAEAPWMYEAQKLLADAVFAQAQQRMERERSKNPREAFREAMALYEKAAESGRSDARLHETIAGAWERQWPKRGHTDSDVLVHALRANDKALQAAPLRASVHLQRAELLSRWASVPGYGSEPLELAVLASAMRAVELDPLYVEAYRKMASIYQARGWGLFVDDRDAEAAWEEAIAWWTRAAYLKPRESEGYVDLLWAYFRRGEQQKLEGKDPRAAYAEAERHFNRAELLNPGRGNTAWERLALLLVSAAEYNVERGLDPEAEVRRVTLHFQEASSRHLSSSSRYLMLRAELTHAQYLTDSGGDPRPQLSRALDLIEPTLASGWSRGSVLLERARCHYLLAVHANRENGDPSSALAEGRQALAEALRIKADCVGCQSLSMRMSLEEAAWAKRQGQAFLPILQRALVEVPETGAQQVRGRPRLEAAEIYRRLAEVEPPAQAQRSIAEGLAQLEPVLSASLFQETAHAHAIQAGLLLVRARTEGQEPQRLDSAHQAQAAFARAFELNPLLQRAYAEQVREVEALLSVR